MVQSLKMLVFLCYKANMGYFKGDRNVSSSDLSTGIVLRLFKTEEKFFELEPAGEASYTSVRGENSVAGNNNKQGIPG